MGSLELVHSHPSSKMPQPEISNFTLKYQHVPTSKGGKKGQYKIPSTTSIKKLIITKYFFHTTLDGSFTLLNGNGVLTEAAKKNVMVKNYITSNLAFKHSDL